MAEDGRTAPQRLSAWLEIFHPAYRGYLAAMLAISIVGGVLTFLNLEFLQGLVKTYGVMTRLGTMTCDEAGDVHFLTGFFVCSGLANGWGAVIGVLLAYILLEIAQGANQIIRMLVQGYLEIRSRNDIEREILVNLLRKDDQFFQKSSATQIANRLAEDTERMFQRREDVAALWAVSIEALGALFFLYTQHWSYAAAVLVFTLGGVLIIHRLLASVKSLDAAQLRGDDRVKAAFEDYLYAAPEAQMGNLAPRIATRFGAVQGDRQRAYYGLLRLNSRLAATYDLTELIAFSAIMAAIVYVVAAHGLTLEDGLVAAVVRAVPQTYGNITAIVKLVVKFQLAGVSADRILEFATEPELTEPPARAVTGAAAAPDPLEIAGLRYAFSPGGPVQGGPGGIRATIPRRRLTVLVGPSGSGKSMLSQLVMGRMKPLAGDIRIGGLHLDTLSQSQRAHLFGYMPQSLAMISGSILDNVRFSEPDPDAPGAGALDAIERTGLGRIAREKALEMAPGRAPAIDGRLAGPADDIAALRHAMRSAVAAQTGAPLVPFAATTLVPHLTVLEGLTRSALDLEALPPLALSRAGYKRAETLALVVGSDRIVAFGAHVVEATRHLLERFPSLEAYNEVAPQVLTEAIWQLRAGLSGLGPTAADDPAYRADLLLVGLTARPREAEAEIAADLARHLAADPSGELAAVCHEAYGAALAKLDERTLNPFLSWRDNLLFAAPAATNAPAARAVDEAILAGVAGTATDQALLETGLGYDVGRHGKRLSGGQRQLVALARTLTQASPILVLDEPTAALDPRRRGEINRLLKSVAAGHTVVVITHDAELARLADHVLMMTDGSLVAAGTYDELAAGSPAFRALVNTGGGPGPAPEEIA